MSDNPTVRSAVSDFDLLFKFDLDSTISGFSKLFANMDAIPENVAEPHTTDAAGSTQMRTPSPAQGSAPGNKDNESSGSDSFGDISDDKVITGSPQTVDTEAPTVNTPTKPTGAQSAYMYDSSKIVYIPHASVQPASEEDDWDFEIGVVNDSAKVYHQWTRFEQFLSNVETRTPLGTRYLLRKPDSLFPQSDDEKKPDLYRAHAHHKREAADEATDGSITSVTVAEWESVPPAPVPTPVDSVSDLGELADGNVKKNGSHAYEEFFKIRPSKKGGLGAFAVRDLKAEEIILVEKPMLRTSPFFLRRDLAELPVEQKLYYMTLAHDPKLDQFAKVEDIWQKNSFAVPMGIAIFGIASRFNHACQPVCNVNYAWDDFKEVMTFSTTRVITAGEELTVTYGGSPISLYARYGFVCKCGGCISLTDEHVEQYHAQMYRV